MAKQPAVFLLFLCVFANFVARIGAVDCDSSYSCDDNYTCCRNSAGKWACCPYRNAVCCPSQNICCRSGLHCSSNGCVSRGLDAVLANFQHNFKEINTFYLMD